ncbi:MAG: hypothetical protein WC044_02585 [Crocinitomicaceae bacterium]
MKNNLIFFVAFIILAFPSWSQTAEGKLSQNTVFVGEKFEFTLEVPCQENDKINYQPEKKALIALRANVKKTTPDKLKLELLEPFVFSKEKIQGKYYWQGKYSLICFDTGYFVLPPTTVKLNQTTIEISPALLRVNLMAKKKNIDIYDIQENFAQLPADELNWKTLVKDYGLWILLVAAIVATLYFAFFYKKKKPEEIAPVISLTPFDKAKKDLNELMEKQMWRNDLEKEHFTELSLIIRNLLNTQYKDQFVGKTSFEIQLILRKEHFSAQLLTDLGLILNVSDMVKFAQSSVQEEGIQAIYAKAVDFVNEMEKR